MEGIFETDYIAAFTGSYPGQPDKGAIHIYEVFKDFASCQQGERVLYCINCAPAQRRACEDKLNYAEREKWSRKSNQN